MGDILVPCLKQVQRTLLAKVRELPLPGKTLVRCGDRVQANEVVAAAELPGEVHILRIADVLGIEPAAVMRDLRFQRGQTIQRGDVLLQQQSFFGLFSSTVSSPVDGTIDFLAESLGHVAIREKSRAIELRAYVDGVVTEVIEGSSVTIEADATFVQGIFGIGGEKLGTLCVLAIPGDTRLSSAHIPESCTGAIVVGGTLPSIEVLRKLEAGGAVGVVVGAIDDEALRAYLGYDLGLALTGDEQVALTIIATEGFGSLGLSDHVISLLKPRQGSMASMNGATQVRAGAMRPEIIINRGFSELSAVKGSGAHGLRVGAEVRVVRVPYFGRQGRVGKLPVELQTLETGALARVAHIEFADGEIAVVPRSNIEVLERSNT